MNNCEKISEMLIDYINRRLSSSDNSEVVFHLASCPACRNEVAQLILLKKVATENLVDIPDDVLSCAFNKIHSEKSTLDEILDSGSYYMAFDLVNYVMSLMKNTVQLAKQAILI